MLKKTARIYLSHSNYLLEECLRPDVEPTTIIPLETSEPKDVTFLY